MSFNSLQYALFLPLVCALYFLLPHRYRWALLLLSSYCFYASWNPDLIVLILFTTATSYLFALLISRTDSPKKRKTFLILGTSSSLLCLFFFKYFNFFSASATAALRRLSLPVSGFSLNVILPVGISFYTFQTLSYIIDVYRGKLAAECHFGIYALYVSFFPQLVAGPIERAVNLLPQFKEEHFFDTSKCSDGLRRILLGLFKKIVIADGVAVYVNAVYNNVVEFVGFPLIAATALFAVQIYCDFSAYSDIAIGSARLMGFRLMENFRSPYLSRSVREFWRRWHISLSTWFTDYVYIPLGGSRVSRGRHLFNLLITFLLSGLWHGAAWTFVIWGALHGLCLAAEVYIKPLRDRRDARCGKAAKRLWSAADWLVTAAAVLLGWAVFRANSVSDLLYVLQNAFCRTGAGLTSDLASMGIGASAAAALLLSVLLLAVWEAANRDGQGFEKWKALPSSLRYLSYYLLGASLVLCTILRGPDAVIEFIYFQF